MRKDVNKIVELLTIVIIRIVTGRTNFDYLYAVKAFLLVKLYIFAFSLL